MEPRPTATASEVESLRREWARHESIMRTIAEPGSQEGGIAKRAFERLTDIAGELQLDSSIVDLAHQVWVLPIAQLCLGQCLTLIDAALHVERGIDSTD